MKALRRLNEGLPILVYSIIIYGVILWLILIYFMPDKIRFSVGLLVGIISAIGIAINISTVLYDAMKGEVNPKMIAFKSILRYFIVALVFIFMAYFKIGSILSAFIGVMGLKVSAYLYPMVNAVISKKRRKTKNKSKDNNEENLQIKDL